MTPGLADVNVWLALLVKEHVHHASARTWFESLAPQEAGLCRVAQLGLLRLLGNRAVMAAGALSAAEAWGRVEQLLEDERVEFLAESPALDSVLPGLLGHSVPSPNLITDAYLAAFAISANRALITLDRGFRRFRGLQVRFLKS